MGVSVALHILSYSQEVCGSVTLVPLGNQTKNNGK